MTTRRSENGETLLLFNTLMFRTKDFIFMEIINLPGSYFQNAFVLYNSTEILFLEFDVLDLSRIAFYFKTIVSQNDTKRLNFISSKETFQEIEKMRNIQNIQNVVWDRNEWNSDDWNLNKEISKNRGRIFNQNFFLNINEKREISYEFVPSFQSAVNDQKNYHLGYFIEDYKQLFENHEMEFKINLYEKAIKTYLINYLETYRIKEEENEEEIQEEHERVEFENILQ
jgi:hypothetical protein